MDLMGKGSISLIRGAGSASLGKEVGPLPHHIQKGCLQWIKISNMTKEEHLEE